MRVTIKEKREVAKGTLEVIFDLGGESLDYQPGQYFWVELLDPPYDDEKGARRHISAVTSPTERGVIGFATRIRDSAFKRSLVELPVGTEVEVEQPKGEFLMPDDDRPLVFVAGGIGITTFRSMLVYLRDTGSTRKTTLIYSNSDQESSAFLAELEQLAEASPNVHLILTMTKDPEWTGETRRIDGDFVREYIGDELNEAYFMVAGPPDMAKGATAELQAAGIGEGSIATDSFSGY